MISNNRVKQSRRRKSKAAEDMENANRYTTLEVEGQEMDKDKEREQNT